jgi:hypothetical protein
LTAPGGKLWELQVYYHWVRYIMNKEQREMRRSVVMA